MTITMKIKIDLDDLVGRWEDEAHTSGTNGCRMTAYNYLRKDCGIVLPATATVNELGSILQAELEKRG